MTPPSRAGRAGSYTRRQVLRAAGGAGVAAWLAACGGEAPAPTPAAAPVAATTPTAAGAATTTRATRVAAPAPARVATGVAVGTPGAGATRTATVAPRSAAAAGLVRLPDTGVRVPAERVALSMVDNATNKAPFLNAVFAAYSQKYPNVTINHDTLPGAELQRVIPIGIQNGNAPDLFALPLNVTGPQAVREGWVRPLDDIIPNFAALKEAYPPGTFFEGTNVFNGKAYTIPTDGEQGYDTYLYYNVEYLRRAGVDPQARPLTWDEYRATARTITQQGAGNYYGVMIEGNDPARWAAIVRNLGQMAGAPGDDAIDWRTGEYNYTSDAYLGVLDLLLALKADGSVFPGALSLNANDARARVAQGAAGMILTGLYSIPFLKVQNPDFNYDVVSQPVPNGGAFTPVTYGPPGGQFWVYAKSKYPQVVGDILAYTNSKEGQATQLRLYESPLPVRYPDVNAQGDFDPRMRRLFPLIQQQNRLGPAPVVRNPDVSVVLQERRALSPNFGTVVQGIFSGQLRDPKAAMRDLTSRADRELDRAIEAARMKGAKVSHDDWKFANWDPTRDYTQEDYDALAR
jgi:multiple sugar transport system substrate-binding protein